MTWNVLFVCTGNSARSIIAEAILNKIGADRFRAFSAGSNPEGVVNPHTLETLKRRGFDVSHLHSKSWNLFAAADAPKLDFVITVCYRPAGEVCPVWPGQPVTAQWGMPDPAATTGSHADIAYAFSETYRMLENRLSLFVNLKLDHLNRLALQKSVKDIPRQS